MASYCYTSSTGGKLTPEPGGVGATCRGNCAQVLFSLTESLWMSLSMLELPSFLTLTHPLPSSSSQTSEMRKRPSGHICMEFHILSKSHTVWSEMNRQGILAGKRGFCCLKPEEGGGSRTF